DCRTAEKSLPCLMRVARPKRRRPGLPSAMGSSDGRETLAAGPAAVAQEDTAALARVAAQETVLAFAPDLRGLILSLHKSVSVHAHSSPAASASLPRRRLGKDPVNGTREHSSGPEGVKRVSFFFFRGMP